MRGRRRSEGQERKRRQRFPRQEPHANGRATAFMQNLYVRQARNLIPKGERPYMGRRGGANEVAGEQHDTAARRKFRVRRPSAHRIVNLEASVPAGRSSVRERKGQLRKLRRLKLRVARRALGGAVYGEEASRAGLVPVVTCTDRLQGAARGVTLQSLAQAIPSLDAKMYVAVRLGPSRLASSELPPPLDRKQGRPDDEEWEGSEASRQQAGKCSTAARRHRLYKQGRCAQLV